MSEDQTFDLIVDLTDPPRQDESYDDTESEHIVDHHVLPPSIEDMSGHELSVWAYGNHRRERLLRIWEEEHITALPDGWGDWIESARLEWLGTSVVRGALADAWERTPAGRAVAETGHPRRHLRLVSLNELLTRPAPEWFIDRLLMQSSIALMAGEPGVGKSFIALDMAAAIANGTPWWGHDVKQGRVLYVAGEGADGFGKRIRAWEQANTRIDREQFYFVEEGVNLSDEESVQVVKDTVEHFEADLVILDTFSQLSNVESENDAAQVGRALRAARDIRMARSGAAVLIVHHLNKSDNAKVRGSGVFRANVETAMIVYKEKKGLPTESIAITTRAAKDGKSKDAEEVTLDGLELTRVPLIGGGDSAVVTRQAGAGGPMTAEQAIDTVLSDGEAHAVQAILAVLGDDSQAAHKRVVRVLARLERDGKVARAGSTRATVYRLSSSDMR